VSNSLNVFNDDVARTEQFSESSYAEHELILRICAARVVVEIRMTLAGWSRDDDVDFSYGVDEDALSGCNALAEIAIDVLLDLVDDAFVRREVRAVYVKCDFVHVTRERVPGAKAERAARLCDAKREATASGEQVRDVQLRRPDWGGWGCSARTQPRRIKLVVGRTGATVSRKVRTGYGCFKASTVTSLDATDDLRAFDAVRLMYDGRRFDEAVQRELQAPEAIAGERRVRRDHDPPLHSPPAEVEVAMLRRQSRQRAE
jgi:hypothetical protein